MTKLLTSEVDISNYIGKLPQYGGPSESDLRLHAAAVGVPVEPWNKYRVRDDIQRACKEKQLSLTVPPMDSTQPCSKRQRTAVSRYVDPDAEKLMTKDVPKEEMKAAYETASDDERHDGDESESEDDSGNVSGIDSDDQSDQEGDYKPDEEDDESESDLEVANEEDESTDKSDGIEDMDTDKFKANELQSQLTEEQTAQLIQRRKSHMTNDTPPFKVASKKRPG
eukprot:SAG25_NODE_4479_length_806_cov_1.226308_2_plen_223_part_01